MTQGNGSSDGPWYQNLPLAKLAAALTAWSLSAAVEVQVSQAQGVLAPEIDVERWWAPMSAEPAVIAAVAVMLLVVALSRPDSSGRRQALCLSMERMSIAVAGLLLLRCASLLSVTTTLFPPLSMLWGPHASWAVSLSVLVAAVSGLRLPTPRCASLNIRTAMVFSVCLAIYAGWTLYVCQMTIVHGDEGHYLRITKSLLHDGDIDLSNNLAPEFTEDFTAVGFGLDKAPVAPPGKIYSYHPPGLAVLIAPAYSLGMRWWGNPRLGTALFMAILTAACVALLYRWLAMVGPGMPLATSFVVASSVPLLLFSTQVYPDVVALLIILVLLCATPETLVPSRLAPGTGVGTVALVILLCGLIFLHPRFIPVTALCGAMLLARAERGCVPRPAAAVSAIIGLAAVVAWLSLNVSMFGDWMGSARPGNAFLESDLSIVGIPTMLKDQWLIHGQGLLNSSPVSLIALIGLALLVVTPDRRLVFVLSLYAVTVGVNGLAQNLTIGYQPAGRYLIIGLPAIALCLATGLRNLWRNRWGRLLVSLLVVMSWDTVWQAVRVPEMMYGAHLELRRLEEFFPWGSLFPRGHGEVTWTDLVLWFGLAGGVVVLLRWPRSWRLPRPVVGAALLALPALWALLPSARARLDSPPLVASRSLWTAFEGGRTAHEQQLVVNRSMTGVVIDEVTAAAQAQIDSPGLLMISFFPILPRGDGHFTIDSLTSTAGADTVVSSLLAIEVPSSLPATQWRRRYSVSFDRAALGPGPAVKFFASGNRYMVGAVEYAGNGDLLAFGKPRYVFSPEGPMRIAESDDYPLEADGGLPAAISVGPLGPGRFRATFDVQGMPLGAWFEYRGVPLELGIYAVPHQRTEDLLRLAKIWMATDRVPFMTTSHPQFRRPLIEVIAPVWWPTVPFAGNDAYTLDFALDEPSDLALMMKYGGTESVRIPAITIDRLEPDGHPLP